ncbi:MAG: RNA chaperone Hfq [Holophagales bacterium]|jgi:sRNA-binding regulator protein Hfq|nr:RNA chaperone Hfq [Holophagales bacterium]
MNRKLIRPNLEAIKERLGRSARQRQVEPKQSCAPAADGHSHHSNGTASNSSTHGGLGAKRKTPPPEQTNAESFYYLKQMQAKTPMVIVLLDGEKIRGLIEWYDKHCIKITCQKEPNILLPKHSIKYMYKQEEEPKVRKLRCPKKEDDPEVDAVLYD